MVHRRRRVARRRRPVRKATRKGMSSGALTNVNRSLQPIPNRYICKMKYSTTIATAAAGQFIFNLNSLFDPDRTGVGHQPYGFDPLANLYNRYRVIACGWRVQQPASNTGTPVITACLPSNDLGVVFPSTDEMLENPRCKYITQNPGAAIETLRGKVYLPKLMGRTKTQYMADDNYQATVVSSPNELGLLYLQTFNGLSGVGFGGIGLTVVLEYTVEFFDAKRIAQS